VAVAAVTLLGAALLAHRYAGDPLALQALTEVRRVVRTAMLTGAGLLALALWRLTQRREVAAAGAALLVLGLVSESLVAVGPVVARALTVPSPEPVLRLLPATLAAVLLVAATPGRAAAGRLPVPTTVLLTVLLPAVCAGAALGLAGPNVDRPDAVAVAAAGWRCALWSGLALRSARSARRGLTLLPVVLALLAGSALADAVAVSGPASAVTFGIVGTAGAAAAALLSAASQLRAAMAAQRDHVSRLLHDVDAQHEREETAQQAEEERRHEVRSVLAGVRGAVTTLRRYEDQLDPAVRRRLEDAVAAELGRLDHLVDPSPDVPVTDVALDAALDPLLTAEQAQGLDLRVDLCGAAVRGRSADVVTIVAVLLSNARVHAPGTTVTVRAEARGAHTRLVVADTGPGIPAVQCERVFERGARGTTSAAGSGLGLYTARRLAGLMGGTVHVEQAPGPGARMVLTLPSSGRTDTSC